MTKAVWGARVRLAGAAVLLLSTVSCGDLSRQGSASTYLVVSSIQSADGNVLSSDVLTGGGVLEDLVDVSFAMATKDPLVAPSPQNFITVDRYRVRYIRADGRNVEGVDVPYGFDSAFTVTVPGSSSASFTLVRVQAKVEAPLKTLAINNNVISTIAEVTFYGHDQAGRAVSASGRIGVNFANWDDE